MCVDLGITEDEDIYIQDVGELRCCCPLPPNWEEVPAGAAGAKKWRQGLEFNVFRDGGDGAVHCFPLQPALFGMHAGLVSLLCCCISTSLDL